VRCALPAGTFSAVGPAATVVIEGETPDDVYGPLRKVVELRGSVLLMGVGLNRMTMLHLAELNAGRRPFVHWARGADGEAVRVLGGKCSLGFENLAETLAPCEVRITVGTSRWRLFDAATVVDAAANAIREHSRVTHCGRTCIECYDAIAGGPLD
jgi:aminoglycoside 3-N-acetyltransferase